MVIQQSRWRRLSRSSVRTSELWSPTVLCYVETFDCIIIMCYRIAFFKLQFGANNPMNVYFTYIFTCVFLILRADYEITGSLCKCKHIQLPQHFKFKILSVISINSNFYHFVFDSLSKLDMSGYSVNCFALFLSLKSSLIFLVKMLASSSNYLVVNTLPSIPLKVNFLTK